MCDFLKKYKGDTSSTHDIMYNTIIQYELLNDFFYKKY